MNYAAFAQYSLRIIDGRRNGAGQAGLSDPKDKMAIFLR